MLKKSGAEGRAVLKAGGRWLGGVMSTRGGHTTKITRGWKATGHAKRVFQKGGVF